ncbi:MAG: ferritin family protein [Spirochaetes bacterium]|jgi:rubrerythrin|nr:ferritin family protein [Spirochaetota bacterium]
MKYSLKEIIDMAVAIEDNGVYFYTQCAEKFEELEDSSKKEFFRMLADEESEHKKIFSSLLSELPQTEGDFTEEYYLYLNAITKQQVFKDINSIDSYMKSIQSIGDIFITAIHTEQDSIMWYRELLDMYKNDKTRSILNTLIAEEKKHIVKLYSIMNP